jgi:hypothetical protein
MPLRHFFFQIFRHFPFSCLLFSGILLLLLLLAVVPLVLL